MNSGVFPWENKHDSHRTFVPECPREKFVKWPSLVWFAGVTPDSGRWKDKKKGESEPHRRTLCREGGFGTSLSLPTTVGTKITADPEKCCQELISEKLLILLRDRPCLESIIVSSNFQAFLFLQKNYWNQSESY